MIRLTSGDLAEQHGNAIADSCLRDMLAAPDQAARGDILRSALLQLQCLPHPTCYWRFHSDDGQCDRAWPGGFEVRRLVRFIQLILIRRSIGRARWVDSYENGEQGNGK